jgi:serine phosphatase RsbU (regulator of sigma subunit)
VRKHYILIWLFVVTLILKGSGQADYLEKYFPKKEIPNIEKLFKYATAGDSAAFLAFANPYRAKALNTKSFPLLCNIYEKFAIYYFYKGKPDISYKYFDSAVAVIVREKLPEYNYYSVYRNRGVIKYSDSDLEGALRDYKRTEALILKYKVGDIGSLYNNMATLYFIAHDNENGKKYLYKAMPFVKMNKNSDSYIKLLKSLGSVYIAEKQYTRGDSVLLAAADLSRKLNFKTDLAEALYDYNNSLKFQRRYKESKVVIEELIQLTKELKDVDWQLQVTLELARIDLTLNDKTGALKAATEAESIKTTGRMPNLEKLDILQNFAFAYYELGMYKKAAENFRSYQILSEQDKEENEVGKLGALSVNYDRQQDSLSAAREKEIIELSNLREQEKAENKLKQQRIIIIVSLVGFIVIIGFSISLIRANRNKERANKEISYQKSLLAEKNKEVTDSIRYAQRIQQSLLPPQELLDILLPNHFLLYMPKDIVSGDFFWTKKLNAAELFVAVADCTGHGVPGAMMSALSIQNLNELSSQTRSPGELLTLLNSNLKNTLNQDQEGFSKDGLDICLCKINLKERKIVYSGANRNLYVFNSAGIKTELKATKAGIGGHTDMQQIYQETEINLEENDMIVMSTDGFADQFGGSQGKKISSKRFKEWMTNIISVDNKKGELLKRFVAWRGTNDQIDDICVLGFKI